MCRTGDELQVKVNQQIAPSTCTVTESDEGVFEIRIAAASVVGEFELDASLKHPMMGLERLSGFPLQVRAESRERIDEMLREAEEKKRQERERLAAEALLREREAEARRVQEEERARRAEADREYRAAEVSADGVQDCTDVFRGDDCVAPRGRRAQGTRLLFRLPSARA